MKVALINPPPASTYDEHWARFPVLGVAYLAARLRAAGHDVLLLDGKLGRLSAAEIVERTLSYAPELVGITCMTVEFPMLATIATAIKSRSGVPVIAGGAHINAVKSLALEECESIDFGCVGEGEYLITEIAEALRTGADPGSVAGLLYRNNSGSNGSHVVFSGERGYPKDYDLMPFPAWDLFDVGDQIPILTHRGCPFRCTFCGHNSGFKARFRTPHNVIEEIERDISLFKPKVIRFEDETFGLDLKRTKAIIGLIIQRGLHRSVRFSAQTRVDKIDLEFVEMLKDANFETLELGVESGNAEILKKTKKGITLDQVERAVTMAKSMGLKVWCKFILGHPGETLDTIRDTMQFISKLNPDQLSVAIMTPYPGTPIHEMARKGEGGYILKGREWKDYDKYSTGVLELESVSLGQLKLYQILCYARLYLFNSRFRDGFYLVWNHFGMATRMVAEVCLGLMRVGGRLPKGEDHGGHERRADAAERHRGLQARGGATGRR